MPEEKSLCKEGGTGKQVTRVVRSAEVRLRRTVHKRLAELPSNASRE